MMGTDRRVDPRCVASSVSRIARRIARRIVPVGRSRPRVGVSRYRSVRSVYPSDDVDNERERERESTDRPTDGSPFEPSHRPSNRNPVGVRSIKTTDRFARPIESISISNQYRIESNANRTRIDRVESNRSGTTETIAGFDRVSIGNRSIGSIDRKKTREFREDWNRLL